MNKRTREERNNLITENQNLIHSALNKYMSLNPINNVDSYDDLFQSAYQKVVEATDSFDESKGKFSTFVFSVVENFMYDLTSKEINRNITSDNYERECKPFYHEDYEESSLKEIADRLKKNETPYICQGINAILLTDKGYTYSEIAKMLQVSEKDIRNSIYQARLKLRKNKTLYTYLTTGEALSI